MITASIIFCNNIFIFVLAAQRIMFGWQRTFDFLGWEKQYNKLYTEYINTVLVIISVIQVQL